MKILIVDDEPSNLLALEAILEPLGQTMIRAHSGKDALKQALKNEFALVLMDVQMPEMDGFEAAELLRQRASTRDVPIIFLTAISKDQKFVARGYDVGAVDYLFKPYEPEVLRAKVAVFVELAKKNEIIRRQHEALRVMSERELAEVKRRGEQRYADLAESIPQLVWTTDPTGRLEYGNRRWQELTRGESDFAVAIDPEDFPRFLEGWNGALAKGMPWEAEIRFGTRVHLVRVQPRRDDSGQITGWIGTSTDIDDRVAAERALRMLAEASRRLGATLEEPTREIEAVVRGALPIVGDLARVDLEARPPIRVSAGAAPVTLLDDPRFELGPSTVAYSGRPEIHRDVTAELAETLSGRGAENLRFLSELGVTAYVCMPLASRGRNVGTITLVRSENPAPYDEAEIAIIEDLSRRIAAAVDNARLHEMSEKRREELEEANRSKDVFLATLSHELRTPLNAIVGWTDMMRNGQLASDELVRAIETIDRNAHALSHLVADLLDVSRIVTGTLKLDSKFVGVASIVEAALEDARPQCAAKRVALDVSLERVGCVKGDAGRLRQVFDNLLSNALKFTPAGGTIVVRVTRDGELARVVIKDTGEGIAADFLPHVFERFRQAEEAKARGLGLGLAIVKHLVGEHGGTVTAASEGQGRGATFTVALPIAAEESLGEEDDRARPSLAASAPPPELAGVHALVVEDDPDGNELITTILERYGARVTSVGTAAAALDAIDAERPDVLVSDIGLPDRDGIELIKDVRLRPMAKSLPAIALTAYASRQDAAKAIAAGFDAHVAKPVQPGTLGTVVARLMRSRSAGRDSAPRSAH